MSAVAVPALGFTAVALIMVPRGARTVQVLKALSGVPSQPDLKIKHKA